MWGAGSNVTSVFFVLMVSPKASQVDENVSLFRCISSSELAFTAQLSANWKACTLSSFTLVLACSLLRLNSFAISVYILNTNKQPNVLPAQRGIPYV